MNDSSVVNDVLFVHQSKFVLIFGDWRLLIMDPDRIHDEMSTDAD